MLNIYYYMLEYVITNRNIYYYRVYKLFVYIFIYKGLKTFRLPLISGRRIQEFLKIKRELEIKNCKIIYIYICTTYIIICCVYNNIYDFLTFDFKILE